MKKDNHGISENPMYHDTWTLLKKYRDVVWSLELSVQKVRRQFQIEYGMKCYNKVVTEVANKI